MQTEPRRIDEQVRDPGYDEPMGLMDSAASPSGGFAPLQFAKALAWLRAPSVE